MPTATTPDHQPIQNAANEMATPVPSSDAIDLGMLLGTPLSLYSLTPLLRLQESSTLLDYADLQVFASSPLISSARKTGVATPKSLGRMRRQEHELVLNHEGGGPLIENFDAFSTPLRSPGCAMKTRDIAPQPGLDPVPKELVFSWTSLSYDCVCLVAR